MATSMTAEMPAADRRVRKPVRIPKPPPNSAIIASRVKMAGMPRKVLDRANEILLQLEKSHSEENLNNRAVGGDKKKRKEDYQLSFFQLDDPVLGQIKEELLKTDINILTPVEALMKLNDIKKLLGK